MKSKYIQLPPLPSDMPKEAIGMLWVFLKMPKQEQKMIRDFVRESLKEDDKDLSGTDLAKEIHELDLEVRPEIKEFVDLMKKLIGTMIAQSCEVAALIYENYCIEEKSIKEISEEFHVDEESIQVIARCYDKKMKS